MTDEEFHQAICASVRSRGLLAASIRSLARAKLGLAVSQPSAERLARVHTLSSAIRAIEEKLRFYKDLPQARREALALSEASIDGQFDGDAGHRTSSIINVRRAARDSESTAARENKTFAGFQRSMWQTGHNITEWTKTVSSFLSGFEKLYHEAELSLNGLRLVQPLQTTAKTELDHIFAEAVDKFFTDLNSRQ